MWKKMHIMPKPAALEMQKMISANCKRSVGSSYVTYLCTHSVTQCSDLLCLYSCYSSFFVHLRWVLLFDKVSILFSCMIPIPLVHFLTQLHKSSHLKQTRWSFSLLFFTLATHSAYCMDVFVKILIYVKHPWQIQTNSIFSYNHSNVDLV